jgi:hypothetical protein
MVVRYSLVVLLMVVTTSIFAWEWPWHKRAGASQKSTWRWAGFVRDSDQMSQKCNGTCGKHRQKWSGNWKTSWFGNKCECEPHSLLGGLKTEPPKDITYRSAGHFKSPIELANECPKICGQHEEKYG